MWFQIKQNPTHCVSRHNKFFLPQRFFFLHSILFPPQTLTDFIGILCDWPTHCNAHLESVRKMINVRQYIFELIWTGTTGARPLCFCFKQLCASKGSHILRHAVCISCCIVHRQFRFCSWTCWLHTFLVTNFLSHNLNGYSKLDELVGLLAQFLLHQESHYKTGNAVQSGSPVALVKPTFNTIRLLLPT